LEKYDDNLGDTQLNPSQSRGAHDTSLTTSDAALIECCRHRKRYKLTCSNAGSGLTSTLSTPHTQLSTTNVHDSDNRNSSSLKAFSWCTVTVAQTLASFVVDFLTSVYLSFFIYLVLQPKSSSILADTLHVFFPGIIDTKGHDSEALEDLEVGHCELTEENLMQKVDIFLLGHVVGYCGKMILFRDFGFTWLISICWEITELLFSSILPNFIECWWDIVVFDILICNAAGIYLGLQLLKLLHIERLNWYEFWQMGKTQSKQEAPQPSTLSWKNVAIQGGYVSILLIFCNVAELNSFLLKRVFGVHKNHPLNVIRLLLHALFSYKVITNYRKYLNGNLTFNQLNWQFWGYLAIVILEFATAFKHGHLFTPSIIPNMCTWLFVLTAGSVIYVAIAILFTFVHSPLKHNE